MNAVERSAHKTCTHFCSAAGHACAAARPWLAKRAQPALRLLRPWLPALALACVVATPLHASEPDQDVPPTAEYPITFDRADLGSSPLGRFLRTRWAQSSALLKSAISAHLFDGVRPATLAQTAKRAGMECNAAGTECRYSALVRARILPGHAVQKFFAGSNTLRITVMACSDGADVRLQVEKKPQPDGTVSGQALPQPFAPLCHCLDTCQENPD